MSRIVQRAAARNDLLAHFVYLAENAGLGTAERFLANAEMSFNDLAERPMLGVALTSQRPEVARLRRGGCGALRMSLSSTNRARMAYRLRERFVLPATGKGYWEQKLR